MDKRAKTFPDRRLGRSWYGWDGNVARHEGLLREGPALFLVLAALALLAVTLLAFLTDYVFMRADFYRLALLRCASGVAFSALAGAWFLLAVCVGAAALRHRRLAFPWLSRGVTMAAPALIFLFRPLGVSRDRISSSCIALTNQLTRLRLQSDGARPRPMVLLPRCLTRETVAGIRDVAAEFDCPVFVVGTNKQARARIRDFRPSSIVAVACERDLVRGLSEFSRQVPILVIANQRPKGPCLDATIDLAQLRRALGDFDARRAAPPADAAESSRASPPAGARTEG